MPNADIPTLKMALKSEQVSDWIISIELKLNAIGQKGKWNLANQGPKL